METQYPAAHQIRQIAGQVRLLADLMRPVPNLPDVDRGAFAKALQHLAAMLDRVAHKTEHCRDCPLRIWEQDRP